MSPTVMATIGDSLELPDTDMRPDAAPLALLWVRPGCFLMGSPAGEQGRIEDEAQFDVTLEHGFWLGKYPVTQAQYAQLSNGHHWPSLFSFLPDSDNRPVESVSWSDADLFCECLNARYSGRLPIGYQFALPTEAQWEYACRAGTSTRYHCGDADRDLDETDWHAGNSGGTSHPVRQKHPNPWGFHDMHGNVSEWCSDWYGDYPSGPVIEWAGPRSGRDRTIRGRGWKTPVTEGEFRSAARCELNPSTKLPWIGFRICLGYRALPY